MKSSLAVVFSVLTLVFGCSSPPRQESKSLQAVPASAAVVTPEVAPVRSPVGDTEFKAALDLKQDPSGLEPQLRHGIVAKSIDWPASLYATFSVPQGTGTCTSALIGPLVLLTAAHCVPASAKVTILFAGKSYDTKCTQNSLYGSDASADFALCKLDKALSAPAGFQFETVDTSSLDKMLNQKITLTGFGCISDIVAESQSDRQYRIGFNNIDETSSSPGQLRGSQYYAGKENNNLFTADKDELANLCPGDSGGPAFRLTIGGGNLTSRVIVGVNSRVFYRDSARTSYGSSMIASTGGPAFRKWAEGWTSSNGVAACGISGAVPNCRN